MGFAFTLIGLIKALLLPPACLFLLYGLGVIVRRRRPRLSRWARHGAVLFLYLLSTGAGAWLIVHPLEALEPVLVAAPPDAGAIIVLAAGRIKSSPEYNGRSVPNFVAMQRISYAAGLSRRSGLPLMFSGGLLSKANDDEALALSMQRVLESDFGMRARWLEAASRTTEENAVLSAAMLRRDGITSVVLVTDAMHMRRARRAFERTGLTVTPAPTFYMAPGRFRPLDLIPNAEDLRRSWYGLYEWLGLAWYALMSAGSSAGTAA